MKMNFLIPVFMIFSTLVSTAHGRDIRISDCSGFIDKAVTKFYQDEYYYRTEVALFIKLSPELGLVREVGFYYADTKSSGWKSKRLDRVAGTDRYFAISGLQTEHNYASMIGATAFTGSFYFDTENGDRYWLNTGDGNNFVIDPRLTRSLSQRHDYRNPTDPIPVPVEKLRKTADIDAGAEIYLNPLRCR
ncbi:MAG: hypothetical protein A2428_13715 [Bdellovibrionales bacterium RIFOXYC1_FULL_54_43]|nr:MAG: hypothetical protein A2428_13715 [Bdellovibrionales bacterium RIFOXYC1_FULL_54_43]OFZ80007.1 MAG: hypothetical protein A2603_02220 [Bdellovibrionales bacterium RIFOXYD1_FULL_55_31]